MVLLEDRIPSQCFLHVIVIRVVRSQSFRVGDLIGLVLPEHMLYPPMLSTVVPPQRASLKRGAYVILLLPITYVFQKLNIRVSILVGRSFGNQKHFWECGTNS